MRVAIPSLVSLMNGDKKAMGNAIDRFYYTKGIRPIEDLRKPLENELDKKGFKDINKFRESSPTSPCISIIHESKFDDVEEWVRQAQFDLVLFLSKGAGRPTEYNGEKETGSETTCKCKTKYLLDNLDLLEDHLKSENPRDWNCTGWIAPEPEYLPALSILCQGYLALHAEDDGTQENVEPALKQMGWSDDLISDDVDVRAKKHEVSDPEEEYWQVFNGTESIDQVKEEWERDSMDGWGDVESLLNDIEENRNLQPETVAAAYCALVKRLGGEPCQ